MAVKKVAKKSSREKFAGNELRKQLSQELKEEKILAAASYAVTVLPGFFIISLVIFALSKSKFVRLHALQATLLAAIAQIAMWLLFPIMLVVGVAFLAAWAYCTYKAWNGFEYELPVLGEVARKNV